MVVETNTVASCCDNDEGNEAITDVLTAYMERDVTHCVSAESDMHACQLFTHENSSHYHAWAKNFCTVKMECDF